ncbi:hypothetical protein F441_20358 [Phytophthora nicotianae CJ01A1]|uniref:Uncharacterized protein n=1 Tax=Phytophthora nicotianae CJ01A1 TaxID=1317063 RepID=W2VWC9_PHYNI|nr:hypothetical protein F441_20358 [Phytophthora nicotianae CJ01A1]
MEPDVPIARRLDPELIDAASPPPAQLSSQANSLGDHDHLAVSSAAVYADPTANCLVGASSRQWNTAVQEDAAPATRIPSIRSGTIVEGHYAWEPYEEKTQDLIRKDCSLRQIKLNTKTKKTDRITCLRPFTAFFVQGKMDVLYLWYWLKERPEALNSARGGLFKEDEFDILSSSTPTRERRSATPSKRSSTKKGRVRAFPRNQLRTRSPERIPTQWT